MSVVKYLLMHSNAYKIYLYGLSLATIITLVHSIVQPILIKFLIDTISGQRNYNLWNICILFGISQFVLVCIGWPLEDYCTSRYTTLTSLALIKEHMQRLYYYPYSFFQNNLSGNITAKMADIFQLAPLIITTIIEDFIPLFILMISSTILLLKIHILLGLINLIWFILFCILTILYTKKAIIVSQDQAQTRSNISGHVADLATNMLNAKVFSQQETEIQTLNKLGDAFRQSSFKQNSYLSNFYVIQGIFSSFCVMGLIILLVYAREHNWGITAGDFAFVIMINFKVTSTLYKASHIFRKFITQYGSVKQALSLFEGVNQIADNSNAKGLKISEAKIVFDKVKFIYPRNDKAIFTDESITIEPRQKVGVVGYSGSGKSTFVNLILRLWELSGGAIKIDGQNISEVTQDSLRANIGLIPQDPTLFHRSLMENIRYGKNSASDKEVIEAAKKAGADEFILELPLGYHSLVGERGVKLSGGQRQRIAIARAILKNAPILILDEATSNLDSLTESTIQQHLVEFMKNKTTLVIAHRLSTLLYMDRILVFNNGRIVEDGSHQELLSQNGLYTALWNSQIGGFLPEKLGAKLL